MVEVGSRASPGQSSSPAARPRLERAANGGSLGFAPGRDPAASPERAHRIPAKRCFRTRCVSTDLSPGPHTRGKTRALPPCFYRRHRAHSPASLTGRFDLPVGSERARAHRPRPSPIGFPVRQSCCPVLRLGPGLSDILEVTVDRSELSHRRSSISDGRDHGKQFDQVRDDEGYSRWRFARRSRHTAQIGAEHSYRRRADQGGVGRLHRSASGR